MLLTLIGGYVFMFKGYALDDFGNVLGMICRCFWFDRRIMLASFGKVFGMICGCLLHDMEMCLHNLRIGFQLLGDFTFFMDLCKLCEITQKSQNTNPHRSIVT